MPRYANIAGDSGVVAYEIGADFISVTFRTGSTYLYNYVRPGKQEVEQMKTLAQSGRGLSTYISRHVKDRYATQVR